MANALLEIVNSTPTNAKQVQIWAKAFLNFDIHDQSRCTDKDHNFIHDTQLDFVAGAFLNEFSSCVLMASRYSGKSFAAAALYLMECHFKPGIQIAVAAFQRKQSDYIYRDMVKFIEIFEGKISQNLCKIQTDCIIFTNGSRVDFFSGGASKSGVKGAHPNVMCIDEADLFKAAQFDGIGNALAGNKAYRQRLDVLSTNYSLSGEGVVLRQIERYLDFNKIKPDTVLPAKVFRICLIDVLEKCDDRYQCYDEAKKQHCPLWAYCKGKAKDGKGFYAIDSALQVMANATTQNFEAEMLLLRPSSQFSYFHNFDSRTNVLDPDIEWDPKLLTCIAIDIGGAANPHAAVIVQLVQDEKLKVQKYIVLDNFRAMGGLETLLKNVKIKYPNAADFDCFMDSNSDKEQQTDKSVGSYVQIAKTFGFAPRMRFFKRAPGFEIMFNLIKPMVGEPRLVVNSRCKQLIAEIYAAECKLNRGRPTNEPEDKRNTVGDDCLDCLRMVLSHTCGSYAKKTGSKRQLWF